MPRPSAVLPPALARGPFTCAAGAAAGLTPSQLHRASLRVPTPGMRASGQDPQPGDIVMRCREIAPALPPDALFSHVTALSLLRVDLPRGLDPHGPLHVQVGPGSTPPRRRGVVGHERSVEDVRSLLLGGGLRVLASELVWVQLAAELPELELVVLGDALTRRKLPLTSREALGAAVEALPPRARGRARLSAALDRVRTGTDSPMETRLRAVLVDGGLPCPLVNVAARAPDGGFLALPDLSYPEARVAIEYDGDVHRTDRATWRRDVARRQALEHHGWRVLTCTADDVGRTPERTVAWVRAAFARSTTGRRTRAGSG